ncbi:spore maturation protein [Sedimentibacter sp. MB31-C6]|uniref:spore maturation protein n=1 Tax=Sedimentibacter sp. MB31-C6 TaxID=3109366 RepID=UPI002DDD0CD3|nr:nucleoside recognition domain-containing protein [Sedimentibacter sp. MB36-C1]WSI02899.1 nucleoside recognition domain-containing protein [Sedimentibacter sp. MB36-C1]
MLINILNSISLYAIPVLLLGIPLYGFIKKVKVYEVFVGGAKEGFNTAIRIIPYLVAMLAAIGIFRASGAMDYVVKVFSPITNLIGMPAEILPMGIMRSLSGGGAEGMMVELFNTHGPDSLIGRMASISMGSTETTMYCIAVYYGVAKITKVRHTLSVGLIVDAISLIAAAIITNIVF